MPPDVTGVKKKRCFSDTWLCNALAVATDCDSASGVGGRLAHHFACERQALAAFHLCAKLGISGTRARLAGSTGSRLHVTFLQRIADTDVHGGSRIDWRCCEALSANSAGNASGSQHHSAITSQRPTSRLSSPSDGRADAATRRLRDRPPAGATRHEGQHRCNHAAPAGCARAPGIGRTGQAAALRLRPAWPVPEKFAAAIRPVPHHGLANDSWSGWSCPHRSWHL